MSAPATEFPWMTAWLETQAELSRLAGTDGPPAAAGEAAAVSGLLDLGRDYAALAADLWRQRELPDQDALVAHAVLRYQRLFLPIFAPQGTADPVAAGAGYLRFREAMQNFTRLAAAIAADAGNRLASELAREGPDAPPITSLRELHEVWVECGEAAWAVAAHREEFAEAQAGFLAALVELCAERQRR